MTSLRLTASLVRLVCLQRDSLRNRLALTQEELDTVREERAAITGRLKECEDEVRLPGPSHVQLTSRALGGCLALEATQAQNAFCGYVQVAELRAELRDEQDKTQHMGDTLEQAKVCVPNPYIN
jgi:hypothetical protein